MGHVFYISDTMVQVMFYGAGVLIWLGLFCSRLGRAFWRLVENFCNAGCRAAEIAAKEEQLRAEEIAKEQVCHSPSGHAGFCKDPSCIWNY